MEDENIMELPNDYQTEVDRVTVNEQLKLLRKIKGIVQPTSLTTDKDSKNSNSPATNTSANRKKQEINYVPVSASASRSNQDSRSSVKTNSRPTKSKDSESKVNAVEEARYNKIILISKGTTYPVN